jgi:hypothetical protein
MISCRWLIVVIAGAIAGEAITAMNSLNEHASSLERSVCGSLCEPLAFWSFRLAAGAPDASPFQGLRWAMYCGMRDCPAMEKARGWVESYGARVELLIRDPAGGHGGFHRSPQHVESVLSLFEKLDR